MSSVLGYISTFLTIGLAILCLILAISSDKEQDRTSLETPSPNIQPCSRELEEQNTPKPDGMPTASTPLSMTDFKRMSRAEVKQASRTKYQDRLKTLEHFCTHWYEATRYKRNREQWYHLKPYNVLACMNHKAGSTAIRYYIAEAYARVHKKLGIYTKKKVQRGKALLKCGKDQLEEYKKENDTFVFVMVRHPMEHLVSGYNQFIKLKHGAMDKNFNESSSDQPLSPSQLVDRLLEHRVWMERILHFNPYFQNCGLCSGDFKVDAVLKMETWNKDMQFLSDALQIKEFGGDRMHINSHSGKKEDQMRKFFSNLTRTQFEKIVEFYRPDFDMFGYDPSAYYKYLNIMSA